MNKFYPLLFLILSIVSCQVLDKKETVPSYLKINSVSLVTTITEGSNSQNISDLWAYIDDSPIGAFELPAKFPVLYTGEHRIVLKAGIKLNGIAATRSVYPLYDSYIINTNLSSGGIVTINPQFKYYPNLKFEFIEGFEDAGIIFEESASSTRHLTIMPSTTPLNDMQYASVDLDEAHKYFETATINSYDLPKDGTPIFLELNYKCTSEFIVGIYINYTGGSVTQKNILHINSTNDWKKIYVNLTNVIKDETNAKNFKVFISALKPDDVATSTICLDNIKLIH